MSDQEIVLVIWGLWMNYNLQLQQLSR